jgi:hypothetical protein
MIQKNNSVTSAGTKDDSSTKADVTTSAPIMPSHMLADGFGSHALIESCKQMLKALDNLSNGDLITKDILEAENMMYLALKNMKKEKLLCKFTQGYVCAICDLIRIDGGVQTGTKEMFGNSIGNKTLKDLKNLGVDSHDLTLLRKYWKKLH